MIDVTTIRLIETDQPETRIAPTSWQCMPWKPRCYWLLAMHLHSFNDSRRRVMLANTIRIIIEVRIIDRYLGEKHGRNS
jgi:hypothetical protein